MRNICRKQCHISFHSLSFGAIFFLCGAETAFYVFRGKVYLLFFRNFRRHFPDFEQPFLRKNARTGFHVISDTFCKKRQKTSILRLLTGFQEQYFGRVDKTTFHLSRGTFWKQNVFFSENLHYEVFNLFIEKTTNFEKQNPTLLTKLLLVSTAKQCGKKHFF